MILLVSDRQTVRGLPVSHFLPAGIFAYVCPLETARFFAREKGISGAIVDGIPDSAAAGRLTADLRTEYPDLPILFIAAPDGIPDVPAEVLRDNGALEDLAERMLTFIRDVVGWRYDFPPFRFRSRSDQTTPRSSAIRSRFRGASLPFCVVCSPLHRKPFPPMIFSLFAFPRENSVLQTFRCRFRTSTAAPPRSECPT